MNFPRIRSKGKIEKKERKKKRKKIGEKTLQIQTSEENVFNVDKKTF